MIESDKMRYHHDNKEDKGFSLVELSTVLVIIAIIAGGAISVGINQNDRIKIKETEIKLDTIQKALSSYVSINKRLPCPADGSLTLTNTDIGLELLDGNNCDTTDLITTLDTTYGVIPTTTLQIPREFMFDGWGRRFTYAVTNDFASLDPNTNFVSTTNGIITILAEDGNRTAEAVYVLLSHGVNGNGAWPRNGGARLSASSNVSEEENSHMASTLDEEYIMRSETSTYDDLVRYSTKSVLISDAGKLFSETACENAEAIIDGGTDCDLAVDVDRCRVMATIFYKMCL